MCKAQGIAGRAKLPELGRAEGWRGRKIEKEKEGRSSGEILSTLGGLLNDVNKSFAPLAVFLITRYIRV